MALPLQQSTRSWGPQNHTRNACLCNISSSPCWPLGRADARVARRMESCAPQAGPSRRVFGAAISTTVVVGAVAAAGMVVAASAAARQADPRQLVSTGMAKFRRNDVQGAAVDFDLAWEAAPYMRSYLWQRGLAHYYQGRYLEGAQQFRSDVAVNPNDTEEAIWSFICEARTVGPEAARRQFLTVGRDSRPVMRAAYEAFRTGAGADKIRAAISDEGGHSNFYGMLYVGLYLEAEAGLQDAGAREAIQAACATPYAQQSGDYMASLARVHCKQRGWEVPGGDIA